MFFAVLHGNGSMAQFNHGEFGGSGQWMRGGMTMVSDMFNNYLKGRVDQLCSEISSLLVNQPGLLVRGSFQSQSQSGDGYQRQNSGGVPGQSSLFVPDPDDNWWPKELGTPNATGSQNNVQYAYFAGARRLVVKTGQDVWVYDTQDHNIGGFAQQQGARGSITLTSQWGTVALSTLPVVSQNGQAAASAGSSGTDRHEDSHPPGTGVTDTESILGALERLGQLREKGVLSDQEFAEKKAELLKRL